MASRISTSLPVTTLPVGKAWDGTHGHYDTSRDSIDTIVIHSIAGTIQGATGVFTNDDPTTTRDTSAHYGIGLDGRKYQWVSESATAYHAGVYAINKRSIGIEHEDNAQGDQPRPDSLYQSAIELVADICKFYNIPIDRDHIITHNEAFIKSGSPRRTACPTQLDIDRIVAGAKALVEGKKMMTVEAEVFEGLVSASRSNDEVGRYLGLPENTFKHPEFYKTVIAKIEEKVANNVRVVEVTPPEKVQLGQDGAVVSSNGEGYGVSVNNPEKAKSLLKSIQESLSEFSKMLKLL